jgi:hypothetical protein
VAAATINEIAVGAATTGGSNPTISLNFTRRDLASASSERKLNSLNPAAIIGPTGIDTFETPYVSAALRSFYLDVRIRSGKLTLCTLV